KDAAAKIPKPAPVPKAVLVVGLVARGAQERLPIDLFRIDAQRHSLHSTLIVAVPGEVYFVDRTQPTSLHQFIRFLELRHAALLGTDLNDPGVLVLSLNDCPALPHVVRE